MIREVFPCQRGKAPDGLAITVAWAQTATPPTPAQGKLERLRIAVAPVGSDYPHQESTWPGSREILEKILVDVPEDEKSCLLARKSPSSM